jgi:hypothetical protein
LTLTEFQNERAIDSTEISIMTNAERVIVDIRPLQSLKLLGVMIICNGRMSTMTRSALVMMDISVLSMDYD